MDPEGLSVIARHVVRLLVERRFKELEEASHGVRLNAQAMQDAVDELEERLAMPPEKSWDDLDAVAIRNRSGAYAVKVDLWTSSGRSDLSIELTLYSKGKVSIIEVDNIHVM